MKKRKGPLRYPLWAARQRLGLTQAELAARVGCSTSLICAIERRRRTPRPRLAEALANELGEPVERLFPEYRSLFWAGRGRPVPEEEVGT